MKTKMENKKLLVSFLAIASLLVVISTISASTSNGLATINDIKVEDISVYGAGASSASVVAGDLITVKVYFTANENDQNVNIKARLEGDKIDTEVISSSFDVEAGESYAKTLTLRVPNELKDVLSDTITLNLVLDGKNYRTEPDDITLRVQRASYNADIKSISVQGTVNAGENIPVDIVLKNIGYNNLNDLYVTAKIPALGIERTGYFGDIVALECNKDSTALENYGVDINRKCNENDADTVSGRIFLQIPYEVPAGTYTIEVDVENSDTTSSATTQFNIATSVSKEVVATTTSQTFAVGENGEYDVLIVNPTDQLKVYKIVTESSGSLSSSADSSVIAVPAGSSKTVKVTASATSEGEYNFNVNVFNAGDNTLISSIPLDAKVQGSSTTSGVTANNPVVVLTVILAIIFIVLLIVLIVLIGRKPEKAEEFGESYY